MVKINKLEIENVKRVRAVSLEVTTNGLTIIGGNNNQGKTSVLDSIAWCLGGDRYKPSQPQREGSVIPPNLHIELSNGLIVERKGKNSSLKVIDPKGRKSGQQVLNEFVEEFALNIPKFMQYSNKEKANLLLKIIGVDDKLMELDFKENSLYNKRHAIGQMADQKAQYAKELVFYDNVPEDIISASDLIAQQQAILLKNAENQKKRENFAEYKRQVDLLNEKINNLQTELAEAIQNLEYAKREAEELYDESTAELEKNIADIDNINIKIRANLDKEKAETEAEELKKQYDELSVQLDNIRQEKINLLKNADLPLEGLSVENSELTYNGFKWDNMSGSQQLKVAVAIVRKLNPDCGFVLIDKLEQMDINTLKEFGDWLASESLQAIATRVSTGEECSIIIEDGYSIAPTIPSTENVVTKQWKAGEF